MTAGERMIRAARARQRERAGVRVKIRFPDALAARARLCADDVRETLGDWVNAACRQWARGSFAGVAHPVNHGLATRDGSECITVRAPDGLTPGEVKTAVELCCAYCEARRIAYTPQVPARYLWEGFRG